MLLGSSDGTKTLNHSLSSRGSTVKIYKFFFTCLFFFWPIKVETKAKDGIDRINCKCLAPLLEHFKTLLGRGTFIREPLSNGLFETTLIFKL
jgi:hypothetical protein